jgi:hypothetical protein
LRIRVAQGDRNRSRKRDRAALWRTSLGARAPELGACALVAAAVVAGRVLPRAGVDLHAPWPPFYAFPNARVTPWLALAAAGAIAAALAGGRVLALPPRRFALAAAAVALAARVAVNLARHGPAELARPFAGPQGDDEYVAAAPLVAADPAGFVDRFADFVPTLPTHPAGHPPGPSLLAGLLEGAGLGGAWPLTVVVLAAGAATAPLTYALGRRVGDERSARMAALLASFAPAALLEGATSMDAVFAAVAVAAAALLVAGRAALGGVAAAAGAALSYALLAVPVWAGIVLALTRGRRAATVAAAAAALAVAALAAGAAVLLGYEPIGALEATRARYVAGLGGVRPYGYWVVGDLAAFLVALGVPTALALARATADRRPAALALAAIALTAALSGATKAEVERIWLFMVPLAAVAAAPALRRHPTAVLLLLAAQALAVEVLFNTVW